MADTMKDAKLIGSIAMVAVEDRPDRKQAFMDLMQAAMSDEIERQTGKLPAWEPPHSAPETERAGRA